MASRKYYKKFSPATLVVLDNQSSVRFKTANSTIGYFSTDNDYLQQQFEKFMRENRYGLSEIPEAEYVADYVQKKTAGAASVRPWREELSSGRVLDQNEVISRVSSAELRAAVAVGKPGEATPTAIAQPAPEPPKDQFKPSVGKRSKRKVAK